MNLYIFAIGGSGSRVLRSLTMLLASGIETNNNIIPIIIDPDTSNGDLDRTVTAMRMYETVRNELKFDDCYKNKFFSANVTALNNDVWGIERSVFSMVGKNGQKVLKTKGFRHGRENGLNISKRFFSLHGLTSALRLRGFSSDIRGIALHRACRWG